MDYATKARIREIERRMIRIDNDLLAQKKLVAALRQGIWEWDSERLSIILPPPPPPPPPPPNTTAVVNLLGCLSTSTYEFDGGTVDILDAGTLAVLASGTPTNGVATISLYLASATSCKAKFTPGSGYSARWLTTTTGSATTLTPTFTTNINLTPSVDTSTYVCTQFLNVPVKKTVQGTDSFYGSTPALVSNGTFWVSGVGSVNYPGPNCPAKTGVGVQYTARLNSGVSTSMGYHSTGTGGGVCPTSGTTPPLNGSLTYAFTSATSSPSVAIVFTASGGANPMYNNTTQTLTITE